MAGSSLQVHCIAITMFEFNAIRKYSVREKSKLETKLSLGRY
jgi:hypothetical protein